MRLTLYPSDKGDCFLVTSTDDRRLLVDGGMRSSYSDFVARELGRLADAGKELDLVCVSHIDRDHISGILQMLDDHVAWKVHEFQLSTENDEHREPQVPRPPMLSGIWHNGLSEQLEDNAAPIEAMLIATGLVLSGVEDEQPAVDRRDLAASVEEAIRVSRRLSPEQLGIPLNVEFGGGLVHVPAAGPPPMITLGSMRVTVIAPSATQLEALRDEWNTWLRDNQDTLSEIEEEAKADGNSFGLGRNGSLDPYLAQAAALASGLGDIHRVTVPNLASIMLLVEEDRASFLLTGDGHATHILEGLELVGRLSPGQGLHVNVLKVQHHGSEYNITPEFCARITADHYVFCADGEYKNPDLQVVAAIISSRLGDPTGANPGTMSSNPEVGNPFTLWFNTNPEFMENPDKAEHLDAVRDLVEERANASSGKMTYFFRPEIDPGNPGWTVAE